jgi:2'-5' RNA ligase
MNLPYAPVFKARAQIERYLDLKLKFFTSWRAEGEAHITVLTPTEWSQHFATHVERPRLDDWAVEENLQQCRFEIQGVGSFTKFIAGPEPDSTFFFIVRSKDLLRVRRTFKTRLELITRAPTTFDPQHFFPHVTIGFTRQDFHEADGALKDRAHSLDPRFALKWFSELR